MKYDKYKRTSAWEGPYRPRPVRNVFPVWLLVAVALGTYLALK